MSEVSSNRRVARPSAETVRLRALDSYEILDTPSEDGFDDIVKLASILCEAPVALVSLVAGDRQWFKARIGFPSCQTDLNSSVCVHALAEPDLLVIPDLTADTRTAKNPLVVDDPRIRFYAGAPLRAGEHVLGSLCVIDHVPRPLGLTAAQAEGLRALAGQVVYQLDLRRVLSGREAMLAAQEQSEAELRAQKELLQTVTDNVAQAVFRMDGQGIVTFVNPAAEAMFGFTRAETLGRSLHDLVHHSHPDGSPFPAEQCELRQALIDGRLLAETPQVFFRKDGAPRHVLVTNAPVVAGGVVKSAVLTVADVTERRQAETRLADSEAYWRGLFERLREGMVIGRLIRDETGAVVDWRYLEVNQAWCDLVGFTAKQAVGRTVRELLPDIEEGWIDDPAYAVKSGETVTFTRRAGQLDRWYEGRVNALGSHDFVVLFLDVSERVLAERALVLSNQRKSALVRLGDCLRTSGETKAICYTAAAIIGQTLEAAHAGYASVNEAKESVTVEADWCSPGVASIAGDYAFRDYGFYIEDLKRGRDVVIADVAKDARTADRVDALARLNITALVNVPVIEHGQLVAILFVHFRDVRVFSSEERDFVRAAVDRTRAAIARIRAEERQALLNGELSHRLKNTLSMVQGIAKQTLKNVVDRATVNAFDDRLMALSSANDVLLQKDWEAADLREIVERALAMAGAAARYDAVGPATTIGPRAALSTSLLVHELATNAVKYGALTRAEGKVDVRWHIDTGSVEEDLVLEWRETGGPPAREPTRKGFGSRLLTMGLVGTGGSSIRYTERGLEATFRAPRLQVERA